VRDAAIIGAAQRIEHYEIAAYGCARTYARRLNRLDEARLLQETLDEEGRIDRRLTEFAEAHINDDARLETDFRTAPPPRRLRYVPMDVVAKGRGTQAPLAVRNDAGDALGDLDGLLAEGGTFVSEFSPVSAESAEAAAHDRMVAHDRDAAAPPADTPTPARSHDDKIR